MALPVITNWPFKIIDGFKSEWNGASLPLIYDITNTKWPTNSENSTIAITSITTDNGLAKINRGSNDGEVAKEWIFIAGTTNYDGPQQIVTVDGNNLTIDTAFVDDDTGTTLVYFNNYTTLVRVFAGIDPAHTHAAIKPIVLIGTIELRPDTTNISLPDVRDYVKNKLNTIYDRSQASWPNDLNGWTDFYIEFAERYDLLVAGSVTDFTSEFRIDEADGDTNFLKAVHGGLQFGANRGGNMHDFVVKDSPYADVAKWMTDFTRLSFIEDQNFDLSIIIDFQDTNNLTLEIVEFDINNNILATQNAVVASEEYGLYRIDFDLNLDSNTHHIDLTLQDSGIAVSETITADVCNLVRIGENFILQEDSFLIQLEDSGFLILE